MGDVSFDFKGKNFIVVGASSGIGFQVAVELVKAGACVLAIGRNRERLQTLQDTAEGQIVTTNLDVTTATKETWDAILKNFIKTDGRLDGGVYTAGITGMTVLRSLDMEQARKIMDTNYWGMLGFMQAASSKRFSKEGSSYVLFSSVAAHMGPKGKLVYGASKAAISLSVKSMAREISKRGCRVNSISPGWIESPMTRSYADIATVPQHVQASQHLGPGNVTDISGVALFLLSDRSRWMTGTDVVVDGGELLGGADA